LIELRRPTIHDQQKVMDFVLEVKLHQETCIGTNRVDELPFLDWLLDCEKGFEGKKENKVPSTIMLALNNDELVGFSNIRHYLNEELFHEAGHIGYMVRPSQRKKGYAKEILKLSLKHIQSVYHVSDVLVTCSVSNLASEKTIRSQGGIYENTVDSKRHGLTKRFWIHLE